MSRSLLAAPLMLVAMSWGNIADTAPVRISVHLSIATCLKESRNIRYSTMGRRNVSILVGS